jgi:hypothetical protein
MKSYAINEQSIVADQHMDRTYFSQSTESLPAPQFRR